MSLHPRTRTAGVAVLAALAFGSLGMGGVDNDPKVYPKSLGEIKAMTQVLAGKKGGSVSNEFMSRLRQYRYIVGVPYDPVAWDAKLLDLAEHAALVCAKLNQMTHTPAKPAGMTDAEYELCKKGAGESNLFTGLTQAGPCVDGWMDDSDPKNIDRVGHRRWCLNPHMGKTAFAANGNYAAMYSWDGSNKDVPDWDFVSYPTRGWMPIQYFGPKHAWSVSLNPNKYNAPVEAQIRVTIKPADAKLAPAGPELKLDYYHVDTGGFGSGPAIIFRPAAFSLAEGAYLVDIAGVKPKSGEEGPLHFVVHFFNLQKVADGPESAAVYTMYMQGRYDSVQGLPEKLDQVEQLSELLDSEFLRDAALKSTVQKSLIELLKEPALKKEHDASARYKMIAALEQKAGKSKNQLTQVALSYRDLASAYKETRAGQKAAGDFERLKGQLQ
jgi:hypothetical protein